MCEATIKLFKEVLMKKTILIGMVLILMLFLLSSCGVPQEDYDRVSSDLAAVQTQIQSLEGDLAAVEDGLTKAQAQIQSLQADLAAAQADLTEAEAQTQSLQTDKEVAQEKRAEALAYAEYLDVVMYPVWRDAGLTPRFVFESDFEWLLELGSIASNMGDAELSNYAKRIQEGDEAAMTELWDYCIDRIEKALK